MSKRTFLLIVGVLSAPFLLADAPSNQKVGKRQRNRMQQEENCTRPAYVMDRTQRVTVKHREANGIGYQTGYTSLEGFFSTSKTPNLLGFADVRAHIFNDSKKAYNLGVGLRYLNEPYRLVFGTNVFYDYRDARHRAFSQIGVGLEVLSRKWDLRANGYIPVHDTKKKYQDGFLKFKGSSAVFSKRYEFAFIGCELALGRELIKRRYWDLHAKLAGYWFNGEYGKNAGGGLFELSTNITRYVTLKGQASYDTLFRGVFQGEAAVNVPFGWRFEKRESTLSCTALKDLEDRLVETVDRFEIIVASTKRKKAVALDPMTGQPLTFVFVDNTSHSLGTFESPFPTLAQAQATAAPDNVIYVFPGDGTSTGMSSGITLQNNQKLIGSAAPLVVSTGFGVRTIPAQTLNTPVITSAGSVVTLANNNQISGFTIVSASGTTGVLSGASVAGAEISLNKFLQSGTETSIVLNAATGNVLIDRNSFIGNGSGIDITTGLNATGLISANLFQCTATGGVNSTLRFRGSNGTGGGTQAFIFDGNVFVPPATGGSAFTAMNISSTATSGTNSLYFVTNNIVLNPNMNPNLNTGIILNAIETGAVNGKTFKAIVRHNAVANVQLDGIDVLSSSVASPAIFDVDSNTVVNSNLGGASSGISVGYLGGATQQVTLRLADNKSVPAGTGAPYVLNTKAGLPLNVQSPNGLLTGVQAINFGTVTFTGSINDINFIPFTTPLF